MNGVTYRPDAHHRRSIRLPAYDYSQAGAYFVTICTHERELLLEDRRIRNLAWNAWRDLPDRFPAVRLDEFVIMPNHVHGIIWIVNRSPVGAQHNAIGQRARRFGESSLDGVVLDKQNAAPLRPDVAPYSLAAIIRSFKARAAKRINRYRRTPGHPVWQRNYYERIIRDDDELARIRQYIIDNPAKWAEDKNNPANISSLAL